MSDICKECRNKEKCDCEYLANDCLTYHIELEEV
jgi:hypothetical protein